MRTLRVSLAIEFLSTVDALAEIARGRTAIAVARVRTSVSAGYKGRKKRVVHDTAAVVDYGVMLERGNYVRSKL